MAKDTFYFTHDYNSRNDSKIKQLLAKHGYEGYGYFWAIIEDLYNNANALPLHYESIAYDMRTTPDKIESVINDFDLFVIDGNFFGSTSVERRINDRNSKSVKARESALNRWNKVKDDANALRTHCECNAIKESKVKESKIKEIEDSIIVAIATDKKVINERELDFYNLLATFKSIYNNDLLRAFFEYWKEPNRSKTKMRFELEKTWEIGLRLKKWDSNNFKKTSNGFTINQPSTKLGTSEARIAVAKRWGTTGDRS